MDSIKKVAILSSVSIYMLEEEKIIINPDKKEKRRNFEQGNLWGISSRQNIMQTRNMFNLKIFNK